jgi:hypothetical protein
MTLDVSGGHLHVPQVGSRATRKETVMPTDVSVRSGVLHIEDTEARKAQGHPEPVRSGLVVFDPNGEEPDGADTLSEEPDTAPGPHR